MTRLLLIGLLLALTIPPALADEEKKETAKSAAARENKTSVEEDENNGGQEIEWDSKHGKTDKRIKTLVYDPDSIYVIRARYGYQTNIEFSPSEEIQTISVGDRSLWQLVPAGYRLFVRPMDENMTTNMTIITNRRSYQFDLKAGAADDASRDIIYVARFVYPTNPNRSAYDSAAPTFAPPPPMPPPAPPSASGAPIPTPLSPLPEAPVAPAAGAPALLAPSPEPLAAASPSQPNFNYTYSGAEAVAPIQVYDDGSSTYIKYRDVSAKSLPDVYFISKSGQEKLVASRLQGEHVVVEGVASEIVIRSPYGKAFVYNEAASAKTP